MARFAFFADLPNGKTLEWMDTVERGEVRAARGIRNLGGSNIHGFHDGEWIKITRKVEMKASPSRHECDDRCMNATGRVMKCECACGGKNHGRGAVFMCEAA